MKTVRVNKLKLLGVLTENRAKHVEEYQSALKIWRKDVIKEMAYNLETAQGGGEVKTVIYLTEPKSFEDSYNTAIKMLEMSIDVEVDLDLNEFQQYVEDKWQWKNQFVATTSVYNSKIIK